MDNYARMKNLSSQDDKPLNTIVTVEYSAEADGVLSLWCNHSTIRPPNYHVTKGSSGSKDFTVLHDADELLDTVTAQLAIGTNYTDTAYDVNFLTRVPGDIISELPPGPAGAAAALSDVPANNYICEIRYPHSGAGLHEVTFIVYRVVTATAYKRIDTIKAAEPRDPRHPFRFFCYLPAFTSAAGQYIVIRAYYTFDRKFVSAIPVYN